MAWMAEPSGKRGRQHVFRDAAIRACSTTEARFGPPLRQTTGLKPSLLRSVGLDWPLPGRSTSCRRQREHGGARRRAWCQARLGIDGATKEVRAVETTGSHGGDAPILADRLGQIPEDEAIGSITPFGA